MWEPVPFFEPYQRGELEQWHRGQASQAASKNDSAHRAESNPDPTVSSYGHPTDRKSDEIKRHTVANDPTVSSYGHPTDRKSRLIRTLTNLKENTDECQNPLQTLIPRRDSRFLRPMPTESGNRTLQGVSGEGLSQPWDKTHFGAQCPRLIQGFPVIAVGFVDSRFWRPMPTLAKNQPLQGVSGEGLSQTVGQNPLRRPTPTLVPELSCQGTGFQPNSIPLVIRGIKTSSFWPAQILLAGLHHL